VIEELGTGIELDLETHEYLFEGQRVPGVTKILTALGLVDSRWFSDLARDRGSAVHKAVELQLLGKLDWTSVDPRIVGYVKAAVKFCEVAGIETGPGTYVERPVYHPLLRYAGTPDLEAVAFRDPSTIDWKSGGTGMAGLATAGYEMARRACDGAGAPMRRRIVVQLREDGTYKKHDLIDPYDYGAWTSAVSLYNRYHAHKKERAENGI
jgi:hypothetical protein